MASNTQRNGKISLLALLALLLIVGMMGMLGNLGHVTSQKLETQNAADSIAFSSSLWMARGLNTVTAANHLVGEASALAVIHESLGGPELRLGLKANTNENRNIDGIVRNLRLSSPIGRIPNPYVPPFATSLDRKLIEFIVRRTSPSGDKPLEAFATLYDSRLTLKRELAIWLTAKSIANLAFLIPPPFGYLPAIAAYGVHITASVNAALIGKEWLLLAVLEKYAEAAVPIQNRLIDSQVIPTLCQFSAEVAGLSLEDDSPGDARAQEGSLAIEAAIDSVETLGENHRVQATLFPGVDQLRLPVEVEPAPDLAGTSEAWSSGEGQPGWGDDRVVRLPTAENAKDDIEGKLNRSLSKMKRRADDLQNSVQDLNELRSDVQERAEEAENSDRAEFEAELERLDEAIQNLAQQEEKLRAKANEITQEKQTLTGSLESIVSGNSENLSLRHLPARMNAQQERYSQWVRASVPNLDELRAPILGLFKQHLKKSRAAKHFEKWTNRYVLVYAWKFRSGYRLEKQATNSATWSNSEKPVGMLVLDDTFPDQTPHKGEQNWTSADAASQSKAEALFTVLGIAQRDYEPLFSTSVFGSPHPNGITTVSHAMVYNANYSTNPTAPRDTQPRFGWDTLNWRLESYDAPEWGSPAKERPASWPWEVFRSNQQRSLVKLNWQAKLVPVTATRLQNALDGENLDAAASAALKLAVDYSELMTH